MRALGWPPRSDRSFQGVQFLIDQRIAAHQSVAPGRQHTAGRKRGIHRLIKAADVKPVQRLCHGDQIGVDRGEILGGANLVTHPRMRGRCSKLLSAGIDPDHALEMRRQRERRLSVAAAHVHRESPRRRLRRQPCVQRVRVMRARRGIQCRVAGK